MIDLLGYYIIFTLYILMLTSWMFWVVGAFLQWYFPYVSKGKIKEFKLPWQYAGRYGDLYTKGSLLLFTVVSGFVSFCFFLISVLETYNPRNEYVSTFSENLINWGHNLSTFFGTFIGTASLVLASLFAAHKLLEFVFVIQSKLDILEEKTNGEDDGK